MSKRFRYEQLIESERKIKENTEPKVDKSKIRSNLKPFTIESFEIALKRKSSIFNVVFAF